MSENVSAELARIKGLVEGATEGPWSVELDNNDSYEGGISYGDYPCAIQGPDTTHVWASTPSMVEEYGHKFSEVSELTIPDAEFIAAARTDVPRLLAAVEAVLALHRPSVVAGCVGCYEIGALPQPYPCPTVTAITHALTPGEDAGA